MKIIRTNFFFWIICLLSVFACGKEDSKMIQESCPSIEGLGILPDGDRPCIYDNVYLYKSEIYTVCNCCVCDKITMAMSCDSIPLCDLTEDCMDDFFKEARYLFSVGTL